MTRFKVEEDQRPEAAITSPEALVQFSYADVPLIASPTQSPYVLPILSSPSPTTFIPPLTSILTDSIRVSSQVSDTSVLEPTPCQNHIQNPPSPPSTIPSPSSITPLTSLPGFSFLFQSLNPSSLMMERLHHLEVLPHFSHLFTLPRCHLVLYKLVIVLSYLDQKGKLSSSPHHTIRF